MRRPREAGKPRAVRKERIVFVANIIAASDSIAPNNGASLQIALHLHGPFPFFTEIVSRQLHALGIFELAAPESVAGLDVALHLHGWFSFPRPKGPGP